MQLRDYQRAAVYGDEEWPGILPTLKGHDSAMVAHPTGTGKTVVFAHVAELCYSRHTLDRPRRVLVLAHRRELLAQAADKLRKATSIHPMEIGVEMAGDYAGDHHAVVLGSIQSLRGDRLERFPAEEFGLVIVDEAHHATARTHRRAIEHFAAGGAKVLGVTATPYRLDGGDLSEIFGTLAHEYTLLDAVSDGWAVPPLSLEVQGAADLREVETRGKRGDFVTSQLQRVMTEDPVIALTARAAVEQCEGRQAIIFTAGVDQNEALSRYLNDLRPGCAVTVDGKMKDDRRDRAFRRFENRDAHFLINCEIATEGYDNPHVGAIVIARPTKSLGLYMQMIGRGSRLLGMTLEESKANGKANFLIVDMVGVTSDDSVLTASKALGEGMGRGVTRRVSEQASDAPVEVLPALEQAVIAEMEEQRRQRVRKIRYEVRETDPLAILGIVPEYGGGKPADRGTLEFLARHGIKAAKRQLDAGDELGDEWLSASKAREIQKRIHYRFKHDLCTPRQAAQLAKRGLPTDVSFEKASEIMKLFAGTYKWRVPKRVIEQLRTELTEETG